MNTLFLLSFSFVSYTEQYSVGYRLPLTEINFSFCLYLTNYNAGKLLEALHDLPV